MPMGVCDSIGLKQLSRTVRGLLEQIAVITNRKRSVRTDKMQDFKMRNERSVHCVLDWVSTLKKRKQIAVITNRKVGGTRHIKRRLLRFGFDVLKSWENFKLSVKNKATWMPRGCVIYIPQIPYSHWCIPTPLATIGIEDLFTYRRGAYALLVSTDRAILRSLRTWSERQCRASRFFCVC